MKFIKCTIVLLLAVCSLLASADVIEKIVAVVNNEIVLESDFKSLKEKLKRSTLIDDSLIINSTNEEFKTSRKAQLDYLINEKILDSEVKRLNLSISMDRVEQEIRDMAKKNGVSSEELLKTVKSEGISASEYQFFLKTKMERQSLIESEIISKLRITDDEAMSEYIKKNKGAKQSVNEFSLAHIFFNPKKGGLEAAHDRAKNILQKLKSGSSFETLAEQFSEDPNFANGGFLGNFKTGEFLKEVEVAISSLGPNETTDVIKSKIGYHIVKLLTKKITTDPRFEKEKDLIKSHLMELNFKRQLKIWLQSKREDSQIRINGPSD